VSTLSPLDIGGRIVTTPAEYGADLARQSGPITDDQAEAAARILARLPQEED
jgi:hypothetical protein